MKNTITLIGFLLSSLTLSAQPSDAIKNDTAQYEVYQLIVKLFDGMRSGDSLMVRSCFFHEVEMRTAFTNKKGEAVLKKNDLQQFINAVGTPHNEVWNEKIWATEIRINGNLAQVWTKYAFFLDDKFSHCGVDAFHCTKTKNGWKIFHLTDTRQYDKCQLPDKYE